MNVHKAEEAPPLRVGVAPDETVVKKQLETQIAIYFNALNGTPISLDLFRGSALFGLQNKKTPDAQQFNDFINRKVDIIEGNSLGIAKWLLEHAEILQKAGVNANVELNEKGQPTGAYALHNVAFIPGEITSAQKKLLGDRLNTANELAKSGEIEQAYLASRPVIRFLEVTNLLQTPPKGLTEEQTEILERTAASAYEDIKEGHSDSANQKLDSIFNVLILETDLALANSFAPELRSQLEGRKQKALDFIKDENYANSATLSSLAILRIERQQELLQANELLPALAGVETVLGITKLKIFEVEGHFSPEKFEEMTGISYNDYVNGAKNGEKGLGLLMASKMRSAIAHLSFSIEKLDASLSKYSSNKDGSQDLRDSLNQYQEATNLFNQVNGMSSALASRMQISEKISEMERIDFLTGDMKILGDAARKELLEQKEKLAGALRDLQTNMGQAFFEFATGNMDEGQMLLSDRSKRITAKVEKEASRLNELFSVARNFELVLFLTSEEAERLLTHTMPIIEDTAYELNLMEKTDVVGNISKRIENIKRITETEVQNPAQNALAAFVEPLASTFDQMYHDRDRLVRLRDELLGSYQPSKLVGGSGTRLYEQNIFTDQKIQAVWERYTNLYYGDVAYANSIISQAPENLVSSYESLQRLQLEIESREHEIQQQAIQIRNRKYQAVAIGVLVGTVVTAATLGIGTGAGIGLGTATTGALIGTVALSSLAVAGGVLSGIGTGASYFRWKVAQDQGASAEEVNEYRSQFYHQLAISVLVSAAGVFGSGLRAVKTAADAGQTIKVLGMGMNALKYSDYTTLGLLTVDGSYATYKFAKEGSSGMAVLTGALTMLPFAVQGVLFASQIRASLRGAKSLEATVPVAVVREMEEQALQAARGAEVDQSIAAAATAARETRAIKNANGDLLIDGIQNGFVTAEEYRTINGEIYRRIEEVLETHLKAGSELDALVLSADKSGLGVINKLFGIQVGDAALASYFRTVEKGVKEAVGTIDDGVAFFVRAGESSDESVIVIVGRGLTNKKADIELALRRAREETLRNLKEYAIQGKEGVTLETVGNELRHSELIPAFTVDSTLVHLNEQNVHGFVTRALVEAEETGSLVFATGPTGTRARFGLTEATSEIRLPGNLKTMAREVRDETGRIATPADQISGVAVEINLAVVSDADRLFLQGLLPVTRKGVAEVFSNAFRLRGLNTFFGHGPTNHVVNVIYKAMDEFASQNGLEIMLTGDLRAVIKNGTLAQSAKLGRHIDRALEAAGLLRREGDAYTGGFMTSISAKEIKNATAAEADASLTTIRIVVDLSPENLAAADIVIQALGYGSDDLIKRLLGTEHALEEIATIIHSQRGIRNIRDLVAYLESISREELLVRFSSFIESNATKIKARQESLFSGT